MSISAARLKAEYKIRVWQRIIGEHPYVAVLQLTGGANWGRSNLKWRVLGEERGRAPRVDARFATPRATREGALRTRYVGIAELFRGAPCAVVYGTDVSDVCAVVRRAEKTLPDAVLVGGRFGDFLIHGKQWREVLDSDGEIAQFAQLVGTLRQGSPLVAAFEAPTRGLTAALRNGARHQALTGILTQHSSNLDTEQPKSET